MNRILLFVLALCCSSLLIAQDITGIATYKTQRKMDIQLDSTQLTDEMREQMMAMIQKQFQREYTLEFNADESVYRQVERLGKPGGMMGGGGVQVVTVGSGDSDVLYRNMAQGRFVNQNEVFGKMFLIRDSIPAREWKLEKESKSIGEYTCFKATYQTTRSVRSALSSSDNGKTDSSEDIQEEEVTVTAWYTPQIPVNHGPQDYGGLPGLILEVSDGRLSILCSKVVINPEDDVAIEEPAKGKEVSQAEYDEILEKKMEEMQERYRSSGRRDDGTSFQIRIGG